MSEIVTIESGKAITTTLAIAAGTHNEHASVIVLVRKYLHDFEEFGQVDFRSTRQDRGGHAVEHANLNEQQATLLLTYMRNSDIVREFKKRLVKAFYEMAKLLQEGQQFSIPTTLSGALRLAAEQAEQIEQQQALIEQQKPAVEFVGKYVEATGSKGFREVCKLLKANETQFRDFLTENQIMYRLAGKLVPYSHHLDAGRFELKTGVAQNEHAYTTSKFTPKGIQWVAGLWAAELIKETPEHTDGDGHALRPL